LKKTPQLIRIVMQRARAEFKKRWVGVYDLEAYARG